MKRIALALVLIAGCYTVPEGPPPEEPQVCVEYSAIEDECPGLAFVVEGEGGSLVCDLSDPEAESWTAVDDECWVSNTAMYTNVHYDSWWMLRKR